jgi:hypothetical protein
MDETPDAWQLKQFSTQAFPFWTLTLNINFLLQLIFLLQTIPISCINILSKYTVCKDPIVDFNFLSEISGSHGGEHVDCCLLG